MWSDHVLFLLKKSHGLHIAIQAKPTYALQNYLCSAKMTKYGFAPQTSVLAHRLLASLKNSLKNSLAQPEADPKNHRSPRIP
ncbi:hypothetical protein N24_3019 [Corynebacterium suranareeae]|uniref:Uncharacterized protein n=1 Tax=Corynebacterium suranareeae TaxID=2506452 RepID=A0A169S8G2_9CORY|nr:hypothetical protein N24_3019 [Corynebacterium suranareeae]